MRMTTSFFWKFIRINEQHEYNNNNKSYRMINEYEKSE